MLLTIRCPAKVNLFLAVGPKDLRNYHPLRSIFQAIDLCDSMTIRVGVGKHEVVFDDPTIPGENTVTKALRLLSEVLNLPPLHIAIEKRIPPESGLGGGSSNAAAVIRAAQAIAGLTIPAGELKGIAEAIGMDVPFFLVGGRAKAEGYGEKLTSLSDLPTEWMVVARPGVGSSTPAAYKLLDESPYTWREFPDSDELYNDFERVAAPESLDLIDALLALGARDAALSGSGSAVFGRFGSQTVAARAHAVLLNQSECKAWVAHTLTRSESLELGARQAT